MLEIVGIHIVFLLFESVDAMMFVLISSSKLWYFRTRITKSSSLPVVLLSFSFLQQAHEVFRGFPGAGVAFLACLDLEMCAF